MLTGDEFNALHRALADRYDLEELRTLCTQLGVPYDDLRGEARIGKARELILWLDRHGRLGELLRVLGNPTEPPSVTPADADRPAEHAQVGKVAPKRPTVLSIHGIRTRGVWQKHLQPIIDDAGFRHIPLDFGFFRALSLISTRARRRQVEWLRDTYFAKVSSGDPPPSIIAHSLGTYLVGTAMERYEGVVFDHVILCGSILRTRYPWSEVLNNGGRALAVLNDYGGRDIWALLANWVVYDAGPSGVRGFEDEAGGKVLQRGHRDRRHSDYFYDGNYRVWAAFLSGRALPHLVQDKRGVVNWRFLTMWIVLIVVTLVLLAWLGVSTWLSQLYQWIEGMLRA